MGSSYAAGPGVGEPAGGPARCNRGNLSYPRLLAQRLSLTLVDASCSGSTTEHVLGPWNELPAQIEAVTPATRLVTITSGGNDVGFVRNLFAAACATMPSGGRPAQCPTALRPTAADWTALETRMHAIAAEVRRRAPAARLVFIDYPTILPARGACPALSGSAADLAASRAEAVKLAAITARVARAERALLLKASQLSARHGPCDPEPWSFGSSAPAGSAPVHPGVKAHAAIAEALAALLRRKG
nr:SGNH/GDSL hydrolase family protein [Novosphingobium piscinae]